MYQTCHYLASMVVLLSRPKLFRGPTSWLLCFALSIVGSFVNLFFSPYNPTFDTALPALQVYVFTCSVLFEISYWMEMPRCLFDYGLVWRCINKGVLSLGLSWDRVFAQTTHRAWQFLRGSSSSFSLLTLIAENCFICSNLSYVNLR